MFSDHRAQIVADKHLIGIPRCLRFRYTVDTARFELRYRAINRIHRHALDNRLRQIQPLKPAFLCQCRIEICRERRPFNRGRIDFSP
ncbi:hypothetical protein [Xenorhabdus bovienii]|uniref:hypothetical protein n=1 Tax=Xenorhabdus bovienii TaxID=40576 RepID=UPI0023B2BBE4|nr:hypothetical protein [Xenorhabdus bovienii]